MFLTSLGNAFVPEIISFTVMRFLLAMFSISIFTVAFVVGKYSIVALHKITNKTKWWL